MKTRVALALTFFLAGALNLHAQRGGRGGGAAGPAQPPRQAAPVDLTGYWVSVVSEDWRVRMTMGQKGDWEFLPLNPEGRKVAESANPAKEDACRAYGAAGLLRIPGHLNITWTDDRNLRLQMDAGTQTRDFHFGQ